MSRFEDINSKNLSFAANLALAGMAVYFAHSRGIWKRRYENSEQARNLDPKTGLYTYPYFKSEVIRRTKDTLRSSDVSRTHGLLLADIDNFKDLNNRLTHPVVDEVALLPAAKIFKGAIRPEGDLASRFGGYPVVVKIGGGSHGVGVIRADSPEALYSLTDYLRTIPNVSAVLRQYIDFSAQARLIVLGNRVVGSLDYKKPKNDFRSNAGTLIKAVPQKFSPEVEAAAVKAMQVLGYEFGGVDILIDKNKKIFYIAEANFPCNFSRCQDIAGVDIAGLMVDYLVAKARKVV